MPIPSLTEPTLIRFDPKRGYVQGNVAVVSRLAANLIETIQKHQMTLSDVRSTADHMERRSEAFVIRDDDGGFIDAVAPDDLRRIADFLNKHQCE